MWLLRGVVAFILIAVLALAAAQPRLPPREVEDLRVIADILKKRDWDFNVDPCSGLSGWANSNPDPDRRGAGNAVACNCAFENNTVCHIVSIVLRGENLEGELPRQLSNLPFLQEIDLSRNLLSGTIPSEWGSMKLVNISLFGNGITGSIPKELANITTLTNLNVEANHLSGTIPREFGSLPQIKTLIFSSNSFTDPIPASLANLSTIQDFRISDNNFRGQIPSFITNWTNIEKLVIQGSGLTGPIPPGIASLTKLVDLRISDLRGNETASTIPLISNLRMLKILILRSCNIIGQLPSYIGEMTSLTVLDFSFNNLTGPIPDSFSKLQNINYIYLTGNSLTGAVPRQSWMERKIIDLSYNNFTSESSDLSCHWRNVNLFASSKGDKSSDVSCLRNIKCEKKYSYLHINCGGPEVKEGGKIYEADMSPGGPSNFYLSSRSWGFSSTGHFLDDERLTDSMLISTNRTLSFEKKLGLYADARRSPLSLTYFASCLVNGQYTLRLHFAEIELTDDDTTYRSHARRLFDVYVQKKLVLKDFDIRSQAGGAYTRIVHNFTVYVFDHTLDIRLYWAGKGTTSIPYSGEYGPLISAISVDDFTTPPDKVSAESLSTGIVVAVFFLILVFVHILWWKGWLGRKDSILDGIDLNTGTFTLRQIAAATSNFDPANKIGEGGFGIVYKGYLPDGTIVAVKQLSSKSRQGNREFVNEIGMISAVQHPHLVKLYGCSVDGDQLLLVYEYMENNSLARALFGPESQQLHLDWPTRFRICIGVAHGLAYLHGESRIKIVHRDIKATNVLLDKYLNPKISDFGLAKLHEEGNTHMSTRIAGTLGYMAPEYAVRGYLTDKADVYSFGVVLLEIVSGRSIIVFTPDEDCLCLLDWVDLLREKGRLLDIVDPRLGSNFDRDEVRRVVNVALMCTNPTAVGRPSMAAVVGMLEGEVQLSDFVAETGVEQRDRVGLGYGYGFDDVRGFAMKSFPSSSADSCTAPLSSNYFENRE
ncbi:probable LRR receptor-like serine/threonine-protein kinase At1g53420 isoform X2 [Andrographis paniculata]|uniref:probable LRR receptor-like serine/threonine-protein kinase At1g53420 isoform X2 n=1 Tax=Andrographis paniculata TaxID=175694 RepID=UPI0021E7408C|nr:probable LRR receptor-like serine/threonine-protein kinase At1g53420 isoform X2 [Andrographis paniculata]